MDVLVSENSHLKGRSKELENQLEQATTVGFEYIFLF